MRPIEPPFYIELEGGTLGVIEHELEGKRVFRVQFDDNRRPITLTVGENVRQEKFWTSIPPGNNQLVEGIGKKIAEHIRSKRK